jgi:ribose 5-phosphate isomerase B
MAGVVMTIHDTMSTVSEQTIRDMVRRVVLRTAGIVDPVPTKARRRLVTEEDLAGIGAGESYIVPPGALISPLAQQAATERKISLVRSSPVLASTRLTTKPTERRHPPTVAQEAGTRVVALGADHGGFELKEILADLVRELGYSVIDCGTHSGESVDYPDFAFAAARLVAQGKAWRAILVDGAGIGSCMAANKVPGVRAAMCYDEATALNSREHNHANVLTLGAGMISTDLGQQIVRTWLSADAGEGRHERRVKKIMDIEQRYLRA